MSLSECLWCGGHIPLGPKASNCCVKCGKPVLSGPAVECTWRPSNISANIKIPLCDETIRARTDMTGNRRFTYCPYCGKPIKEAP